MKKAIFAVAVGLLTGSALAASYSPRMSGDSYVAHLKHSDPMTPADYRNRDRAYSYLEGVMDATEGKAWCDFDYVKTPDLAYDIADEIAAMDKKTRAGNATQLIQKVLRQKLPCKHHAKRR